MFTRLMTYRRPPYTAGRPLIILLYHVIVCTAIEPSWYYIIILWYGVRWCWSLQTTSRWSYQRYFIDRVGAKRLRLILTQKAIGTRLKCSESTAVSANRKWRKKFLDFYVLILFYAVRKYRLYAECCPLNLLCVRTVRVFRVNWTSVTYFYACIMHNI